MEALCMINTIKVKYTVIKYTPIYLNEWNDFINKSKNGTFLFRREFMEYHSDRFKDFSLLIFDKNNLVAILPANIKEDVVYSHQGLTYGGLVYTEKIKQAVVILIFKEILRFLSENNINKLCTKQIPYIYAKLPSQEIDYVLFLAGAKLIRRDSLSVIEAQSKIKIASNRMAGVKKGITNSFIVREEEDFSSFWNDVLIPNLLAKHNASPVHSLTEIMTLKQQFPKNIRLFVVDYNGGIAAGTVLFETDTVIHSQYISAGDDKNELGSLDFLYYHLVNETFANKKYFDFGISNEEQGTKLNEGLIFWKESFGARTVTQDFYEIATSNYSLLDEVLI